MLLSKIVIKRNKVIQNNNMKKYKIFVILLFFFGIFNVFFLLNNFEYKNVYQISSSYNFDDNVDLNVIIGSDILKYKLLVNSNISNQLKTNKQELTEKLLSMGFSKEEIMNYFFKNIEEIFYELNCKFSKEEIPDEIFVNKNSCSLYINTGKEGKFVDRNKFFNDLFENIKQNKNNFEIKLTIGSYKIQKIEKSDFVKKGEYITDFSTSSDERKNNIRTALSKFDGIILNEGEILSFNKTTGERNKISGYLPAKIISGGTFVNGFGGGVCQVSSTLYNACLVSGLEIVEVHNHSLPVSYVELGFDAMVNSGSSDLIVRNNTNGKIVITTSFKDDKCKIVLFGKENKFRIKRVSEKTKELQANSETIIENDYEKYGIFDLKVGEERQISYAKNGCCADSYLFYYDENNKLIKKEKIRKSTYNPTKAVNVRKEK